MSFAAVPESDRGSIRTIAVAYFFGTFIGLQLLSELGVPVPAAPVAPNRDHAILLSLAGSLCLAAALYPLARGIGGSTGRRLATIFAFTFVAFAVVNELEASVFTTLGGDGWLLAYYAIPCLLASGAATWLVQPAHRPVPRRTVFQTLPVRTWWWRPILALAALPSAELVVGLMNRTLLEDVANQRVPGIQVPGGATVMATMLLKSALLLAVTVPVAMSWSGTRRLLMVALGTGVCVLTGLVGLMQATWWPPAVRGTFLLQILLVSAAYSAAVVPLLVPRQTAECVGPSDPAADRTW